MKRRRPRLAILAMSGALTCPALVSASEVRPGETQGLGLMGAKIPAALQTVVADPYRAPASPACETIPAELAALDDVLGPDADEPAKARSRVAEWLGGQVRGLIPYRGVVRFLTRAGEKDKALTHAVMAGFARRGFLRGLGANLECAARQEAASVGNPPMTQPSEPAPAPVATTLTALESDPGR